MKCGSSLLPNTHSGSGCRNWQKSILRSVKVARRCLRNYNRNYQPTDPYAAPRAEARRHHDHDCDCARKRKPAVAPNTYAPAGPVTPSELRSSDPADWLE